MKTVFELVRIYTNSKARYPLRKTETSDLGLFSTLKKAEKQMHKDVQYCKDELQELLRYIAEDEKCRLEEKHYGHDVTLAYLITEYQLDTTDNIFKSGQQQSERSYTADGQPNDVCLLDSNCIRHFTGRTPDQIRFKPGDIVEVITPYCAELCVVDSTQPTVDDYKAFRQRCLQSHKRRCSATKTEYNPDECPFDWDYSDDCYLVYSLGENDTHSHPQSVNVFHPTKAISKTLVTKLKEKHKEMIETYSKLKIDN